MRRIAVLFALSALAVTAACGGSSTSSEPRPSNDGPATTASPQGENSADGSTGDTGAEGGVGGGDTGSILFTPCPEEGAETGLPNGTAICTLQDGKLVWRQLGGEAPILPDGVTCGSSSNPPNPLALPSDNANARASLDAFPVECVWPRTECAPQGDQEQYQWYRTNQSLVVDPRNPSRLLVGIERLGLFESLDRGDTWKPLSEEGVLHSMAKKDGTVCWPEVPRLTFDTANPGRIYLNHGGGGTVESGIWQSRGAGLYVSNDDGKTWNLLTPKNVNAYIAGFAIGGPDGSTLYVGTNSSPQSDGSEPRAYVDNGIVYRSDDAGATWTELPTGWGQRTVGSVLWTDPTNPKSVFLGVFQYRLDPNDNAPAGTGLKPGWYRSGDGGSTWTRVGTGPGADFVPTPLTAISPDGQVIINANEETWVSVDAGETWTKLDFPRQVPVFDPHGDGRRVYAVLAAEFLQPVGDQDQFTVSNDGGITWTTLGVLPPEMRANFYNEPPLYRRAVPNKIVVDPTDPKIIYVSGAGGLIARSTDGGSTWKLLTTWESFTPSQAQIR